VSGSENPSSGAPARRALDPLVVGLVRLVLRIFFRRVEVVGRERLPAGRPLVVVANHVNGMVDPLLILASLPVVPRFLGKHTLWRNPVLLPFLLLGGVIPVYRRREMGADTSKNLGTFARCHELLARGGSVALFPEGTSHSDPALAPLRTGAARIALESAAKHPGLGVLVVPVGLTFEAKGTFRSRALVEIGEPIDPLAEASPPAASDPAAAADPEAAAQPTAARSASQAAEPAAVRALTARIDHGLKQVTLNYGSWEEARLIGRAAELFSRPGAVAMPGATRLAASFSLHRAFIEGYGGLARHHPERTAAAAAAVDSYDRLLAASGLRDDQVAAAYPLPPAARFVARSLFRLLVHLPLALVGMVLNWPTYRLLGEIAGRVTAEPDMPATYKVFGGLVLFPATWIGEGALAGWLASRHGISTPREPSAPWSPWTPWGVGLAVLLLAPATAYAALRFDDARAALLREARAYFVLRARGELAADLRARRTAAARQVAALAELAGRGEEPAEPGPGPSPVTGSAGNSAG
jgi:glycerol-3-phosphate O-acyltransferase/dihydroxyacetone phosphate acyltransferase